MHFSRTTTIAESDALHKFERQTPVWCINDLSGSKCLFELLKGSKKIRYEIK